MGISDKIEFVTIAFYEMTTLEIKATIPDQVVICCSSKLTSWACSVTMQINSWYTGTLILLKTGDLIGNMQRKPLERLNVKLSF